MSEIITVVLLIFISIVAISLVFFVVKNIINKSPDTSELDFNARVEKISSNGTNIIVVVRNFGDKISRIKIALSNEEKSEVYDVVGLEELERKTYVLEKKIENANKAEIYYAKEKCDEDFNCGEWQECAANYMPQDILEGKEKFDGIQERRCYDGCGNVKIESQICMLVLPVNANKKIWCNEDYVEIYEKDTNRLVARVKESEVEDIKRVDVSFLTAGNIGYCPYCHDNIKNFDEAGIDCGGSCNSC